MKRLALILLLGFASCGGGGVSPPPVSPELVFPDLHSQLTWTGETVWEGWIYEDPELMALYEETQECLGNLAIATELPYIIIITGEIYYVPNFPEYRTTAYTYFLEKEIIINEKSYDGVYKHEFIHWLTWRDDTIHNEPFMAECTMLSQEED